MIYFSFKEYIIFLSINTYKGKYTECLTILGKQDVFVCMPTGSGKSLCFQLPAIVKEQKVMIVFSPLLALMKVDFLTYHIYLCAYVFLHIKI